MEFANPGLVIAMLLFYVGFIFIINGLNILGRIGEKECGLWNFTISCFMFVVLIIAMVFQLFGVDTWLTVTGVLLFAFTYFGLGFNKVMGLDGRGLGWYCLLVAITTVPEAVRNFDLADWRMGVMWLIWGACWFVFFLVLGLGKTKLAGVKLGWVVILVGILTLWWPGYFMLRGWW